MAFRWRADNGPLRVIFGSPLPSSTKNKNVVKYGPPLTQLCGSAHVLDSIARLPVCFFHRLPEMMNHQVYTNSGGSCTATSFHVSLH